MSGHRRAWLVDRIFGGGIGATIAARGIDWLTEESNKALGREPEDLTQVRIRPGETYTIIARPRPTRSERKLASAAAAMADAEARMSRPTRRQIKAARRLSRAQKRLDHAPVGSRRQRRRQEVEQRLGSRFDRLMQPSRRLTKVRAQRRIVEASLDASREASFREAAGSRRSIPSTLRRQVFD